MEEQRDDDAKEGAVAGREGGGADDDGRATRLRARVALAIEGRSRPPCVAPPRKVLLRPPTGRHRAIDVAPHSLKLPYHHFSPHSPS